MGTFEVTTKELTVAPHPNADRLDVVRVDGFNCVSQKGVYQTGDIAVYVPENAIVPEDVLKAAGFWNEEKVKGLLAGSSGDRVKPVKLRGVISEGILLNIPRLNEAGLLPEPTCPPVDWAETLGITKYVPPIPMDMAGVVEAKDFSVKYDVENYKAHSHLLSEGEDIIATEKLHGSCTIVRYDTPTREVSVSSKGQASKGLWITEDEHNVYWRVEKRYELGVGLSRIRDMLPQAATAIILFGETLGVQNLKYGANGGHVDFRAFDLAVEVDGRLEFLPYWILKVHMDYVGIPVVPTLFTGDFDEAFLWELSEGRETVTGKEEHIREGLVVRPVENRYDDSIGHVKLKFVSDTYLGKTTGDEFE